MNKKIIVIITTVCTMVACLTGIITLFKGCDSRKDAELYLGNYKIKNNDKICLYYIYNNSNDTNTTFTRLPFPIYLKNATNEEIRNLDVIFSAESRLDTIPKIQTKQDGEKYFIREVTYRFDKGEYPDGYLNTHPDTINFDRIKAGIRIKQTLTAFYENNIGGSIWIKNNNSENQDFSLKSYYDNFLINISMKHNGISKEYNVKMYIVPICINNYKDILNRIKWKSSLPTEEELGIKNNWKKFSIITTNRQDIKYVSGRSGEKINCAVLYCDEEVVRIF